MVETIKEIKSKWPIISKRSELKRLTGGLYLCTRCRSFTYYRHDPHRGERICENCGEVLKENMMISENEISGDSYIEILVEDQHLDEYFQSKSTPKDGRIKWLEERYGESHGDKKGWRLGQYHDYIGIVNTHFQMTDYQKDRVWYIIKTIGDLNELHRQASYEQIITSLCIGIMKKDGRKIYFTNKKMTKTQLGFVNEIKLDETIYYTVMEKLGLLNCFPPVRHP